MKTLRGKRLTDVETFLDNSIEDLDERLGMWAYDLCAFMNQWELVLEAKWILAATYQGRTQSEVKAMSSLKLRYVKGSKEMAKAFDTTDDLRMWDILEPKFPEYESATSKYPTFSRDALLAFLKRKELI